MKRLIYGLFLVLSVSIAACAEGADPVKTEVLAKAISSWDGGKLPPYKTGIPEITILKIEIPPGKELPMHRHPVINAGVLLKGELTVITEKNRTLRLKAGDSIVEVVNKNHYGKNEGTGPAEIIVFYAGIKDQPITIMTHPEHFN